MLRFDDSAMSLATSSQAAGAVQAAGKSAAEGVDAGLDQAAREFESLFVQMLLKNMRAAGLSDGVFDSRATELYYDMFDKEVARQMSSSQSLGIANMLVDQLGSGPARSSATASVGALGGQAAIATGIAAAGPAPSSSRRPEHSDLSAPELSSESAATDRSFARSNPSDANALPSSVAESPADFVRKVWPLAQEAAASLGVDPRALVAQAALESGWGRFVPQRADGSSSFNLFGIKAGSNWQGDTVAKPTLEYEGGVASRRVERFRSYESMAESFADFAALVGGAARYEEARGRGDDVRGFFEALHAGGYATDPQYSRKALAVFNGQTLRDALPGAAQPPRT